MPQLSAGPLERKNNTALLNDELLNDWFVKIN
jgi:hypothetical protein